MSLISARDHDLVIKAIDTFLEVNKDCPEKVEMCALRQWVTLRKSRISHPTPFGLEGKFPEANCP